MGLLEPAEMKMRRVCVYIYMLVPLSLKNKLTLELSLLRSHRVEWEMLWLIWPSLNILQLGSRWLLLYLFPFHHWPDSVFHNQTLNKLVFKRQSHLLIFFFKWKFWASRTVRKMKQNFGFADYVVWLRSEYSWFCQRTRIMYSVSAKEEKHFRSLYRLRFSLRYAREGHFKERVILAV